MSRGAISKAAAWLVVCLLSGTAVAQPTPSYGLDFVTIGAPGNAPASPQDFLYLDWDGIGPIGRVDYEYRLTKTEITHTQWLEFVTAYTNVNDAMYNNPELTGRYIAGMGGSPGDRQYAVEPLAASSGAYLSWNYAARYCNWLHNGRVNERWAFESGAYDTSTFQYIPGQGWTGQLQHSPGARFWIPTVDEWTKGMHYDPNRFGVGQGGYWLYPTSSDSPPVGGVPGTPGAQTGAGSYLSDPNNPDRVYPVGSYPNAMSPWGLLDGSGGQAEWLEGWFGLSVTRPARGSWNAITSIDNWDRLDFFGGWTPSYPGFGLRIASTVPSCGSVCILACVCRSLLKRRR